MSAEPKSTKELLRAIIDSIGVAKTLELAGEACEDKASEYRAQWPDAPLAKTWDKAGNSLKTCATVVRRFHGIT